jgi:hypothetical protein
VARLKNQKKSTNFVNRIFESLIPGVPGPSFRPSHEQVGAGLTPFINQLFLKAMQDRAKVPTMMPAIKRYNDFDQPGFDNRIETPEGAWDPFWDPEAKDRILKRRAQFEKEAQEDFEQYKKTGRVKKRKSPFDE